MKTTRQYLKNYQKSEDSYCGQKTWRLIGVQGQGPVHAFERFCDELIDDGVPVNTRKVYAIAVSQFIDYCYEAGVFESDTTKKKLNTVIKNYRYFLSQGEKSGNPEVANLARILPHKVPAANRSIVVKLSGVRRFLELSEDIANEQAELLHHHFGIHVVLEFNSIVEAVGKLTKVSTFERKRIRNTLIGGVIKGAANNYKTRLKSLAVNIASPSSSTEMGWEFPFEYTGKLIEEANLYRDKALYSLLAGGGIRLSEALNLRWEHIDFTLRRIYVIDPRLERNLGEYEDKKKFKGRSLSRVFIYQPYKDMFFQYLLKYIDSDEYVQTTKHDYVFQITKGKNKGAPLAIEGDESSQWKNFNKLVKRIGVCLRPDGKPYSPYSLRHQYGVWMLNYHPHDNGYGFPLPIVQKLMGHAVPSSTEVYAKHDVDLIDETLEYFDRLVILNSHTVDDINMIRAKRKIKEIHSVLSKEEYIKFIEKLND